MFSSKRIGVEGYGNFCPLLNGCCIESECKWYIKEIYYEDHSWTEKCVIHQIAEYLANLFAVPARLQVEISGNVGRVE